MLSWIWVPYEKIGQHNSYDYVVAVSPSWAVVTKNVRKYFSLKKEMGAIKYMDGHEKIYTVNILAIHAL